MSATQPIQALPVPDAEPRRRAGPPALPRDAYDEGMDVSVDVSVDDAVEALGALHPATASGSRHDVRVAPAVVTPVSTPLPHRTAQGVSSDAPTPAVGTLVSAEALRTATPVPRVLSTAPTGAHAAAATPGLATSLPVEPAAQVPAVRKPYKRLDPRLRVRLPVNVWEGKEWRRDVCGDVSLRGLYLETLQPLEVGTVVRMSMLLVDKHERFTMDGHVRHVVLPHMAVARPAGMGIKFSSTTPVARRRWREFIRWLLIHHPKCETVEVDFSGQRSSPRLATVVDRSAVAPTPFLGTVPAGPAGAAPPSPALPASAVAPQKPASSTAFPLPRVGPAPSDPFAVPAVVAVRATPAAAAVATLTAVPTPLETMLYGPPPVATPSVPAPVLMPPEPVVLPAPPSVDVRAVLRRTRLWLRVAVGALAVNVAGLVWLVRDRAEALACHAPPLPGLACVSALRGGAWLVQTAHGSALTAPTAEAARQDAARAGYRLTPSTEAGVYMLVPTVVADGPAAPH